MLACALALPAASSAENTIYLQDCGRGVSRELAKKAAERATKDFAELGLKTQVRLLKAPLDETSFRKLDKTDSAAFFGDRDDVVAAVGRVAPGVADYLQKSAFGWNSGEINPEVSLNPRDGMGDDVIAVSLGATKTFAQHCAASLADAAGFLIAHGAGHNSNLQHAGGSNGYDPLTGRYDDSLYMPQTPNIMSEGGVIVGRIETKAFGPETLDSFVSSPNNRAPAVRSMDGARTLSIQAAYLKRFGSQTPKAVLPVE